MNKVILIGNTGTDADYYDLKSKTPFTVLNIATNSQYKDKNTGEKKSITDWHKVFCYGKLAEITSKIQKGTKISVEGEIKYSKKSFYDENGELKNIKQSIIRALKIEFLSAKTIDGKEITEEYVNALADNSEDILEEEIPF